MIDNNDNTSNVNKKQADPMNQATATLKQRSSDKYSSSEEARLSWRDIPSDVIGLLDSFPYDENFKITIQNLREGNTILDRIKKHSVTYQECYLSQALYYFINRDYKFALKAIKRSERYNRLSRFIKLTPNGLHRSTNTHFYCLVLRGVINYLNGSYRKARRFLIKSNNVEKNEAVQEFISLIDHILSRK